MKHKILYFVMLLLGLWAVTATVNSTQNYRFYQIAKTDKLNLQQQIEEKDEKIAELTEQLENEQLELEECQEELGNAKLELKNYLIDSKIDLSPLLSQQSELYKQCAWEMIWQIWGLNLLYCKELELPVFRTVADCDWNLIQDVSLNNFTTQTLDSISFSPCTSYNKITSFSYLLTDNEDLAWSENPPTSGWFEILPDTEGNYQFPLTKADGSHYRYVLIKYSFSDEDTYYGLLTTGITFQ